MFDKVEISIKAGGGGDGFVSFRQEKFVPFGGPDGGDGGAGGNVYIVADRGIIKLNSFRARRHFKGSSGDMGGKQKKHGRKGADLSIPVPLGTLIFREGDSGQEILLADLNQQGQKVLAARGGTGGLGNVHFATATNQAPRTATRGKPGEEQVLVLELKLVADVSIIGQPNIGKSSLLAAISRAKPEIADYPYTTREPILGKIEVGMKDFVVAELPGIISGAHLGKGLGYDFLRHAERSKVVLYLLDGSSSTIIEDMNGLDKELSLYNPSLVEKPYLIAINKIDLPQVNARLSQIRQHFKSQEQKTFFVSATTGQGLAELVSALAEAVELDAGGEESTVPEKEIAVFRPKPRVKRR